MTDSRFIDGVLVQWGERLFFPNNRRVSQTSTPRLSVPTIGARADVIRARIESTICRAPQVMIKVTGGGRGMAAVAAHMRYISRNGRLPMENDQGTEREGKEAIRDIVDQWRLGGSHIPERSERREAFNIMLSMPRGTDPLIVQRAAREFALAEFADHRYVMVLHDHQANPHVHLSVKAESRRGKRLNPRKVDLQRWRETFAEKLRGWGVDAEATRQATRGQLRAYPDLWRAKAQAEGRLKQPVDRAKSGERFKESRRAAIVGWLQIGKALETSDQAHDRELAASIIKYLQRTPVVMQHMREHPRERQRELPGMAVGRAVDTKGRNDRGLER